jgi:hypothetical protein
MRYTRLTSDVPLGPFEGAAMTVWSAPGTKAKIHASPSCSSLRSARAAQKEIRLEAATVDRMCPQCTAYGRWARPGTSLGMFLDAMTGPGLPYELHYYAAADEDTYSDDEVDQAAALLHAAPHNDPQPADSEPTSPEDLDEEAEDSAWEKHRDAERVRDSVFDQWRAAVISMHRAHTALDLFPWLKPWAAPQVQRKSDRLEALRAQAAQLVARDALETAAAASALDPALPADDPAFALLGTPAQAKPQLTKLWQRWRCRAEASWEHPREHGYLTHHLTDEIGGRRKGRQQMLDRAQHLLAQWTADAQAHAADMREEKTLVAQLPERGLRSSRAHDSLLDRVDQWELAVLASYLITIDWTTRTLTLRVPDVVATQLMSHHSTLDYAEEQDPPAPPPAGETPLRPGVFDDTPVSGRQPVTAAALRALRSTTMDPDQLYLVFSAETGADVVPLNVLEQRCTTGWTGVILASASDLPDTLFDQGAPAHDDKDEQSSVWLPHEDDPHAEEFGRHLGLAEGQRVCIRLTYDRRNVDHALRTLALARSVTDLRTLDSDGYDEHGNPLKPVPNAVWHGLLAMEQLDLQPFAPDTEKGWHRGSGLPLGVLAAVQAYTTDAQGLYQGRAHSPGCTHRRADRGIHCDDDLVTIEELRTYEHFDPCSKCGGYAIRRLTDTQLAYYQAAHQLHDLTQHSHRTASHPTEAVEKTTADLDKLDDHETVRAWLPSPDQARHWHQHIDRLRHTLPTNE